MEKTSLLLSLEEIVNLFEAASADEHDLYDFIRPLASRKHHNVPGNVKSVAVHTDFQGWDTGHYRAVVDMARELKSLGYRSIVMLDNYPPDDRRPSDLDIVVLTPLTNNENCKQRLLEIEEACHTYDIDAVILNGYAGWKKYIDYLMFKRASDRKTIKCFLQFHSQFCRLQNIEIGNSWLEDNTSCINVFDGLLTESSVDTEFWSVYNPRSYFRPLPVPYNLSQLEVSDLGTRTILYLGRLDGTKNQKDAIKAFSLVHKRFKDAKMILAGDGKESYKAFLRRTVHKEGLEDAVVFAGFLAGEDKRNVITHAACAVSTSKFEGYPLALAEQMAYGLPVVMFDIPSLTIAETGKDGGVAIVRQRDCVSLANEIIALLEDDDYRREMGKRAHRRMKDIYDFDYGQFWDNFFNGRYIQRPFNRNIQIKIYRCFFNAFSNNKLLATNLSKKLETCQIDLAETRTELERNRVKLKNAQERLRTTKGTLKSVRSDLKATKSELKETKRVLSSTEATITKIKNSRSWKITKPLRKIAGHD